MTEQENKLPDYIDYPYNRFLKLRVELLILSQNEVEAKIMRLIEWCIDNKRGELYLRQTGKTPRGQKVVLPEEIWVAISHRFFLDQLHGTVQSETTLKEALANLEKKYLIFKRPGGKKKYDSPEYTLNKRLINKLFQLFPKDFGDIDMTSIMKQPRKKATPPGGQLLPPSNIDPLIQKCREAIIDPINRQLLTPRGAIIDPIVELGGGQLLPPKREEEISKEEYKDSSYAPTGEQPSFPLTAAATVSLTQLKNLSTEELAHLKAEIDSLMVKQQDTNTTDQPSPPLKEMPAAPDGQNDQKEQNINEGVEGLEESPKLERPDADAPRIAETVVQLIEYLRGMPYESKAYAFELRKAQMLLGLKDVSNISIAEIEEAWLHGSDDYWRGKHDGDNLHVHDLVNTDSKGKYRVLAFLAHKRAQDRQQQSSQPHNSRGVSSSVPTQTPVVEQSTLLSEEQAQAIIAQIAQDAQEHGFSTLHGELQVNGTGWLVRVSWACSYWKGDLGLEISSEQQWQNEFREWRGIFKLRKQLGQKIEAEGQEV